MQRSSGLSLRSRGKHADGFARGYFLERPILACRETGSVETRGSECDIDASTLALVSSFRSLPPLA